MGRAEPAPRRADPEAFEFDASRLEAYIDIPFQIYKFDNNWIPPLRSGMRTQLSAANPWFSRGKARHFLLPGVGRCSAFHTTGSEVGHIGFFECRNDHEAAAALLGAAEAWLRSRGARTLRGPIAFDTWHAYRFVTSAGDHPPFLLEPYNPPYYPELWIQYGFKPSAGYFSNLQGDMNATVAALEKHYKKAARSGFVIRPLDLAHFEHELEVLYALSIQIFGGNWGYQPIEFEEFAAMYRGSRRMIDPDLVLIAHSPNGRAVGLLFGLPDQAGAVRAMGGSGGLIGGLKFLLAKKPARAAILKTLGVIPEARGTNVGFALCWRFYRTVLDKGYAEGIDALMIDENASRRMSEAKGGRIFREYALYDLVR